MLAYRREMLTKPSGGSRTTNAGGAWKVDTDSQCITLIAQISFHIELCRIEARDSISLYTTPLSIVPSGFRGYFV